MPPLLLATKSCSFRQTRFPHDFGTILDSSREHFLVEEIKKHSGELVAVFGEVLDVLGGVRVASAQHSEELRKDDGSNKFTWLDQRTFQSVALGTVTGGK